MPRYYTNHVYYTAPVTIQAPLQNSTLKSLFKIPSRPPPAARRAAPAARRPPPAAAVSPYCTRYYTAPGAILHPLLYRTRSCTASVPALPPLLHGLRYRTASLRIVLKSRAARRAAPASRRPPPAAAGLPFCTRSYTAPVTILHPLLYRTRPAAAGLPYLYSTASNVLFTRGRASSDPATYPPSSVPFHRAFVHLSVHGWSPAL